MAFTVTEIERGIMGTRRYVIMKGVSAGGSTGGDFSTGLNRVLFASLTEGGSAVDESGQVINGTFPIEGGTVTCVTTANVTVYLYAIGQ